MGYVVGIATVVIDDGRVIDVVVDDIVDGACGETTRRMVHRIASRREAYAMFW